MEATQRVTVFGLQSFFTLWTTPVLKEKTFDAKWISDLASSFRHRHDSFFLSRRLVCATWKLGVSV
eukprot:m.13863 g.13863  ORF g.13863 m.13863 type:complete len:66 (+) comp25269_c0_seq1:74-271(+)